VLFNTWGDEPPLGILLDESIPDVVVGVDDDSGGGDGGSAMDLDTRHSRSDWSETYTLLSSSQEDETSCPQILSTTATEKDDDDNGIRLPAKIWLLGNERRRDHPMRTLKLSAPESLQMALFEETVVSRHLLDQI